MEKTEKYQLFIASPPGLEEITLKELESLPTLSSIKEVEGGVMVESDIKGLLDVNINLGSANRVLLRLSTFLAPTIPQFVKRCSQIKWENYLSSNSNIQIQVSSSKSKLYHNKKIEQLLREAIVKRNQTLLKDKSGSKEKVFVRIKNNLCTISIDTSGDHLHMRGYREMTAKAPIRENLAFGILKLIQWTPDFPLIDPMCGAGTFPIEAARIANGILPGANRSFSFVNWPCMIAKKGYLEKSLSPSSAKVSDNSPDKDGSSNNNSNSNSNSNCNKVTYIQGFDKNIGAIKASKYNAKCAGVEKVITFEQRDFSQLELESESNKGHLVINPPYGERIGEQKEIVKLYKLMGRIVKERFKGWKVTILCSDKRLRKEISLPLKSLALINNGGIRVYVYHGQI